jgi:hypothetical protein
VRGLPASPGPKLVRLVVARAIAPINPADLATTIQTLEEVTARGRALLSKGSLEVAADVDR